jgi:hypothetical protein
MLTFFRLTRIASAAAECRCLHPEDARPNRLPLPYRVARCRVLSHAGIPLVALESPFLTTCRTFPTTGFAVPIQGSALKREILTLSPQFSPQTFPLQSLVVVSSPSYLYPSRYRRFTQTPLNRTVRTSLSSFFVTSSIRLCGLARCELGIREQGRPS